MSEVILKTKAFEIRGQSITEVVERWFKAKPTFQQYEDVVIQSIETVEPIDDPDEEQIMRSFMEWGTAYKYNLRRTDDNESFSSESTEKAFVAFRGGFATCREPAEYE